MGIRDRSSSRGGYSVRVLAVHTTEGGGTAAALRDADWWVGSSHAIADKSGTLLTPAEGCVDYERASWTLRNGNSWSENIELIGYAATSRTAWLRDDSAELDACARWLAARSKARGIPLIKLTPQQYRAGGRGVIGHHDHTVGYSDGTHWDPGPGFPWDVVLERARQIAGGAPLEDEMNAEQEKKLDRLLTLAERQKSGIPGVQEAGEAGAILHRLENQTKALRAENAALRAAVMADKDIDEVTMERIVREAVAESVVTVDVNVGGSAASQP